MKFLSINTQTGLEDTEGREKLRQVCFRTKFPELFVSLLRLKLGKKPWNPLKSKRRTLLRAEAGLWISIVMGGNGEIILLNVLQFT